MIGPRLSQPQRVMDVKSMKLRKAVTLRDRNTYRPSYWVSSSRSRL